MQVIKSLSYLLFLTFITGCSHNNAFITKNIDSKIIKKITVDTSIDAYFVLKNQESFIKAFYSQSVDPYSGKHHLTEKCIEENKFYDIIETKKYIFTQADIYVDYNNKYGFCSDSASSKKISVIIYHCFGANKVYVEHSKLLQVKIGSISCN